MALDTGCIQVGGVAIDSAGLHDVRSQMTVIPQNSFVFGGSLKFNVDPFGHCTDARILDVLRKVRFVDTLAEADGVDSGVGASAVLTEDTAASARLGQRLSTL